MPFDIADAASWLDVDLALLTATDAFRPRVERPDLQIGSRPTSDDANDLFRWRLSVVNATPEVVFEGFVHRILDYHAVWTREFVGGHVVRTSEGGTRVLYQHFDPGVPGVADRDLCSAEVVRALPDGALLASFRSVDEVAPQPGRVRIDWWGAVLCRPVGEGRSELVYLDRENQGGRFPARLMNRLMPTYLVRQAEAVRDFFADGGPPELSSE